MSEETLSIVIPVYNREEIVKRTLMSVSRQTLRPLTVILVDNNSSDSTMSVLKSWRDENPDINVIIATETTSGASAARQHGLDLVNTEWTMFFDSDDVMHPDHCKRVMTWAKSHAGSADMIGWDVMMRYSPESSSRISFPDGNLQYHSLMHGATTTTRYMARTKFFRRAGGWNPTVRYWDDIELGARLLNQNPVVTKMTGDPTVEIYVHDESITGPQFSKRIPEAIHTLSLIARHLPSHTSWVDLKMTIFAADCTREGSGEGKKILRKLLKDPRLVYGDVVSPKYRANRLLINTAYYYRRLGGRGIARLLQPLLDGRRFYRQFNRH